VWAHSARFAAAVRSSHRLVTRATLIPARGAPVPVPVAEWEVTCDRTSKTRRTLRATLGDGIPLGVRGLSVYGALLQLEHGIDYGDGAVELLPVGRFRLDSRDTAHPGVGSSITGYGLEQPVQDAKFLTPRTASGSSAVDLITTLIREAIPGAVVINRASRDTAVRQVTWDQERWDAIDGTDASLASALGAEVFADGRGRFIITDVPTIADRPVWTVDEGPGGVKVSEAASETASGVNNIIVATGDGTDGTAPVGPVIAYDDDPTSPTYWRGPFGARPRFYSSPLLTTAAAAGAAARSVLADSLGIVRSLSFESLPHPGLEPGDVVGVAREGGRLELHLIDRLTLSATAAMRCETRTTGSTAGSTA
jgi:hypothetical protein